MTVVGLTGQSGAGKTTVSEEFVKQGFAVINCDETARKAVEPNSECAKELEKKFPDLFENGKLNRKKAAAVLFSDRDLLDRYNAAIFPHINRLIENEIKRLVQSGHEYILLDAPTLFEAGADALCGYVVSCIADAETRLKRITERDGISEELALKRFSSQKSEEFFRERSDRVIENNGDIEAARDAAKKIAEQIKGTENG